MGPLLRVDGALGARLSDERGLSPLVLRALLTIALGAGAYGFAFGLWRHPLSALASAVKLPALICGVALLTTVASATLAPLLRANISLRQTAVLVLLGFSVTSAVLGALAPVSILVVLSVPPPDPAALGLPEADPLAAPSVAVAQGLVLFHTAVIALAGVAGVLQLVRALSRLEARRTIVHRVVLAWLGLQLFVGAQLSWIVRPFLGRPNRPVELWLEDALEGSFFEEVARLSGAAFGDGSLVVLGAFVLLVGSWLGIVLWQPPERAEVSVREPGLDVRRPFARLVPWRAVRSVEVEGSLVRVRVVEQGALFEDELEIELDDPATAVTLGRAIEEARLRTPAGPFRTAPASIAQSDP
jgi:hypothetical protein